MFPEHMSLTASPLPFRTRHLSIHLDYPDIDSSILKMIFGPNRSSLASLKLFTLANSATSRRLIDFFARAPFTNVRSLVLDQSFAFSDWPDLVKAFPFLAHLDFTYDGDVLSDDLEAQILEAVGSCVPSTLQRLRLRYPPSAYRKRIMGIKSFIGLPNLVGIRHLELPTLRKDDFACEAGVALLQECEERSVSLLCRYGYL